MSKELIFKGLLDLQELATKTAQESTIQKEKRDLTQVAKVINNTLFKLGYRKPKPKKETTNKPDANIFINKKKDKDMADIETVRQEIHKDKILEIAKEKQVKNLNGGKKKNATKKQTEQIKLLYAGGSNISQISDDLNLIEDTVYSILGIDKNDTGVVLATNIDN